MRCFQPQTRRFIHFASRGRIGGAEKRPFGRDATARIRCTPRRDRALIDGASTVNAGGAGKTHFSGRQPVESRHSGVIRRYALRCAVRSSADSIMKTRGEPQTNAKLFGDYLKRAFLLYVDEFWAEEAFAAHGGVLNSCQGVARRRRLESSILNLR
jgi:hypothetical protein